MSTVITVASDGTPLIELPDHKGRVHAYTITPLAVLPPALWAVLLCRADDADAFGYTVQLIEGDHYRPARWTCDCPDSQYRRYRRGRCKHCRAAQDLVAIIPPMPAPERGLSWARELGRAARLAAELARVKEIQHA